MQFDQMLVCQKPTHQEKVLFVFRTTSNAVVHDNLVFFWIHNHAEPMTWDMDGEEQFVVAENVDGTCVKSCNGLAVVAFSCLQMMHKKCLEEVAS